MSKPSFFHNGGKDTLWSFYNHVTLALQQSHPRTWMEDQRILHYFISTVGNFQKVTAPDFISTVVPVTVPEVEENTNEDTEEFVDPNQTSILDQIESTYIEEAELVSLESEPSTPVEAKSLWVIDGDMIGDSDEFLADAAMQELSLIHI